MNPEAQAYLETILKKDPSTLTTEETGFLKARASYLKKSQLEEYSDLLTDTKPVRNDEFKGNLGSYQDLFDRAKELGYVGRRINRSELEKYIEEHTK